MRHKKKKKNSWNDSTIITSNPSAKLEKIKKLKERENVSIYTDYFINMIKMY